MQWVVSLGGGNVLGEPVETFVKSISTGGASGLNIPSLASDGVKTKFVGDLWGGHGSWEILLVGIHKHDSILELFIVDHLVEFFTSVIDSVSIV